MRLETGKVNAYDGESKNSFADKIHPRQSTAHINFSAPLCLCEANDGLGASSPNAD